MLLILAIPYLVLLLAVFFGQRRLLYHPDKAAPEVMSQRAADAGLEPWTNATGQSIGWRRLSLQAGPCERVLVLHGNAGSAVDRADYAGMLANAGPCDVYILEYPGYGARSGAPSEAGLNAAAEEGITLLEREGPVRLVGESLGNGVACHLAGTHPLTVSAMLLVAPYENLADVAQAHLPIFPARWMLWDKFPAGRDLMGFHGPVAVLLAGRDEVIPNRFGRRLYDGYAGPKKLWVVPDAGHNDLPGQPAAWWRELGAFWRSFAGAAPAKP